MSNPTLLDYIALNLVSGISTIRKNRELQETGSPAGALRRLSRDPSLAEEISRSATASEKELERAARIGARIVAQNDHDFPELLREIPDCPIVLYVKGTLSTSTLVSIVGTRRATAYGLSMTEAICGKLSAGGIGIISGLAVGIDAAAHKTALKNGNYTAAVFGSGLDIVYPHENKILADKIVSSGGALLSDFPIGQRPRKYTFPLRNRIVAGLSCGTCVTEAPEKSGALITARLALEYNRYVWAVPHAVGWKAGAGCLSLIRQGAIAVTSGDHILEDLLPVHPRAGDSTVSKIPSQRSIISESLGEDGATVDEIIERTGLRASEVYAELLRLEIAGNVASYPGGVYRLKGS